MEKHTCDYCIFKTILVTFQFPAVQTSLNSAITSKPLLRDTIPIQQVSSDPTKLSI